MLRLPEKLLASFQALPWDRTTDQFHGWIMLYLLELEIYVQSKKSFVLHKIYFHRYITLHLGDNTWNFH